MTESLAMTLQRSLVGAELAEVAFVRDYVQLGFDGPRLTAYALPVLQEAGREIRPGTHGWRDALCSRIGEKVSLTEVNDSDIVLHFGNDCAIKICKDYNMVEWFQFTEGDQRNIFVGNV